MPQQFPARRGESPIEHLKPIPVKIKQSSFFAPFEQDLRIGSSAETEIAPRDWLGLARG